uniref:Uncharacterized protein n=1 Tax=Arundo donax TaxID=35708 RepID=A0A0A9BDH9_ARUDO
MKADQILLFLTIPTSLNTFSHN